jgi:coenzyme F420-0:L-glutamate ligase/coenzyme F420-1:gamma-L-glutamate ligase
VIKGRRSIRRYKGTRVENQTLEKILQAALWAPSAHNRQPWRWIVLQRDEDKLVLANAMGKDLVRMRTADGDDPIAIQQDFEKSVERIGQAPVVIIACLDSSELDRYPDTDRSQSEYLMAVQSVAMAGQNIMLLAHTEGLGSCWMCAPLFSPASIHETFNVPEVWKPQGLILLGHPDSQEHDSSRKPLVDVVRWI